MDRAQKKERILLNLDTFSFLSSYHLISFCIACAFFILSLLITFLWFCFLLIYDIVRCISPPFFLANLYFPHLIFVSWVFLSSSFFVCDILEKP